MKKLVLRIAVIAICLIPAVIAISLYFNDQKLSIETSNISSLVLKSPSGTETQFTMKDKEGEKFITFLLKLNQNAVEVEVQSQLEALPRKETALKALENSRIIVISSLDEQIDFVNEYATEHLIISMNNPWTIAERITAAGSVFVGNYTPESAGDYASGTNHTLPTSGWARSMSGVNLDSFIRKITYQEITQDGIRSLGKTIVTMAQAEGLEAHANAAIIRMQ